MRIKRLFIGLAVLLAIFGPITARAQLSKSAMIAQMTACLPTQLTGSITPAGLLACLVSVINSYQQYTAVNAQVGTSYTIQASDYGQLVTFTNSGAVAVTLPSASSFTPFNTYLSNLGAGTVTITPSAGTINGASTLVLTTGQGGQLVSDGTNWQVTQNSGTPGGSNTYVQFNNSSAFGGDSGFTYAGSGQATLALGTITTNLKALSITGTWNNSGTTFDAPLLVNVTETAVASGSKLMDIQVGGTSALSVDRYGGLVIGSGGTGGTSGIDDITHPVLSSWYNTDAAMYIGGAVNTLWSSGNIQVPPTMSFNNDVYLSELAAGQLMVSDSTTATKFIVSESTDSTTSRTNYADFTIDTATVDNTAILGTNRGGTSTWGGLLEFRVLGTNKADFGVTNTTWTFVGPMYITSLANTATTSAVCYNTSTGLLTYDGTIGTCTTSDERLKTFDQPLTGSLGKLVALSESSHFGYFRAKGKLGMQQFGPGEHIGMGAQTVAETFPSLTATGTDGYMSLDYAKMTVPIIESLKEIVDSCREAANDNFCQQLLKKVNQR